MSWPVIARVLPSGEKAICCTIRPSLSPERSRRRFSRPVSTFQTRNMPSRMPEEASVLPSGANARHSTSPPWVRRASPMRATAPGGSLSCSKSAGAGALPDRFATLQARVAPASNTHKPVLGCDMGDLSFLGCTVSLLPCRLDLHQVIEKRGARAEVGQAAARRHVAVDAVLGVLIPPHALRDDHAGLDRIADHGLRQEAAAVVEDARHLAIVQAAGGGVDRVDLERRLGGGAAEGVDVDEGRVEKR